MKQLFLYGIICYTLLACSDEPTNLSSPKVTNPTLNLSVAQANTPADNYTYAEIIADINPGSPKVDQITFATDKGVFSNGKSTVTVTMAENDRTKVYLKHNQPEIVHINASLSNKLSKGITITFTPAYPSLVLVSPDSVSLHASLKAKSIITTTLLRTSGSVNGGLPIIYYDSTTTGGSIGTFLNTTFSNAQGVGTVEYRIQDPTYRGFVYVKAYVNLPNGKVIGVNKIYIE